MTFEYPRKLRYGEYCSPQEMMSYLITSLADINARIDEMRKFIEIDPGIAKNERFAKRYGNMIDTRNKIEQSMNQVLYSEKFNKTDENGQSQMRCVTKEIENISK